MRAMLRLTGLQAFASSCSPAQVEHAALHVHASRHVGLILPSQATPIWPPSCASGWPAQAMRGRGRRAALALVPAAQQGPAAAQAQEQAGVERQEVRVLQGDQGRAARRPTWSLSCLRWGWRGLRALFELGGSHPGPLCWGGRHASAWGL